VKRIFGILNGVINILPENITNLFRSIDPPIPFSWIWKSKLWPKLKVFAWLLLSDRLKTRNMLKRRHLNIGNIYSCALCTSGDEETLEHLFFCCPLIPHVG
jgi:hypothetical protein